MTTEKLPSCEIEYREDIKCVIQHWAAYSGSANFRNAINRTTEIFKEKGNLLHIISDTSIMGVLKKEDTDWVAQKVNPVLIKLGLRKIAFIVPKSIFGQMAVDNYKNESKEALAVRYFDSIQAAILWMKE